MFKVKGVPNSHIFFRSLEFPKGLPMNRSAPPVRKGGPLGYHWEASRRPCKGLPQKKKRRVNILFRGKTKEEKWK